MNTMMIIFLATAVFSMIAANISFARGKCVDTGFVIAIIASFAFSAVAAATAAFGAFGAISASCVAISSVAADASSAASVAFAGASLFDVFAFVSTGAIASARRMRSHVLLSIMFYIGIGVSGGLYWVACSFVF